MTMTRRILAALSLIAGFTGMLVGPAGLTLAAEPGAAPEASSLDSVRAFSQASQELYRKISPSMVRVRTDMHWDQLLPEPMQKDLDNAGPSGPGAGPATTQRSGSHARNGGPRQAMLREHLEQRLHDQKLDPDSADRLREVIARIDAQRQGLGGEMIGIIIDQAGHVLVHAPLIKDAENNKLQVVLPDGTESTATLAGTDMLRGLSVITLDTPGAGAAVALGSTTPVPGAMLLALSSGRGTLTWTVASEAGHRRHEMGFQVGGTEDRSPAYLFDTDGQLVALSGERRAAPISLLEPVLKDLIANRPLPHRVIGVSYSVVGFDSPLRDEHGALGQQPAVVVDEVTPGSPAAHAGLIKGDFILRIDHKPINQLRRALADIRDRGGDLELEIVRNNEPHTLKLSLERPAPERPAKP